METIFADDLQISKGGGTGTLKKEDVYQIFVKFTSLPGPDKAEMFGIPFDEKKGRYERIPTQKDFALKYGVSEDTLSLWKRREGFQNAVDAKHKDWGVDKVADVLASLYRRCMKYGLSYDIELFLAYYKNWNKTQVVKQVHEKFDMNDLRALLAPLPKEKQDEFYATVANILTESELHRGSPQVSEHQPVDSRKDA